MVDIYYLASEYYLNFLWLIVFFEVEKFTVVRLNLQNIVASQFSISIILEILNLALTNSGHGLER